MSSFIDLLERDPDQPALHIGEVSATRGELKREAQALASYLASLGFRRGHTLAIWLPDGPAWLQFLFAASQLGVLVVPISTRYRTDDARHVVSVARAKAIVVASDFLGVDYIDMAHEIRKDLPHVEHVLELARTHGFFETDGPAGPIAERGLPSDFLCTFSTSGTTGRPKLAPHDQASIARHCLNVVKAFDIKPGDVMLCALPLNGVLGFIQTVSAIAGRAACVLLPVFNPAEAARLIEKFKVTHFYGADSMFDPILNIEGAVLGSWRNGGFAEFVGLGQHVTEKAERRLGLRLVGLYGSSECFALMSLQDPRQEVAERALAGGDTVSPDISVRVVDAESGQTLAEGEPGELQVKGYNVTPGYLNNPEASKQAFSADGWFCSGDLAYARGRGFVYQARMKDGLRLKGYLVDPGEIEAHLMQHGAVAGAQVVGVKLPGEGDVAVAFVRPGPKKSSEPELIAHCRSGIANYKVPRRILFVDEFPQVHGSNGSKITKNKLREMAEAALALR